MIRWTMKAVASAWIASPLIFLTLRGIGVYNFHHDIVIFGFLFAVASFVAFMCYREESR
jgi:hypothetical protein